VETAQRLAVTIADMAGPPSRRRKERLIRALFRAAAVVSLVISALIVVSLAGKAVEFLTTVPLGALWGDGWFPRSGLFDLKTIVAGSLVIAGIGMAVAAPLGLGAALYLSEYAAPAARRTLKPALEILAGIPSVVLGFFALTWISPHVVQRVCGQNVIFNMAAAGIGVGILVTPLVASIAEDALRAVPMSLREASYGLGARKISTTLGVVLPGAVSGVAASLIVGVSRAIGETMIVAIAAGATGGSLFSINPCLPGQTMTAAMASLAIGSDQVAQAGAFQSLFFVGLLLFAMTLSLNMMSERFVRRFRQRY
jgi:phosphate transport system permease protein